MKSLLLAGLLTTVALAQPPPPCRAEIVFVGAHPDDDSTATATLARYVQQGHSAAVITATRGEQGGNQLGPESGSALGLIREQEERAALALLGIHQVYYLNCVDTGFTTSLQQSQRNWGRQSVLRRLVRLIRFLRPAVIITMNPGPRGHGDHQLISQLASQAFFQAGRGGRDSEGLSPWSPSKLYYSLEYGADGLQPSLLVNGEHEPERQALSLYKSQGWPENMPAQPETEAFVLAASRVTVAPLETDLLAGLGSAPVPPRPPLPAPAIELARTPALQRFLRWSRGLGLSLDSLAPPTRVCQAGQSLRWPLLPHGYLSLQAPRQLGPYPNTVQVGGHCQQVTLQVVPSLSLKGRAWSQWQLVTSPWEGKNGGPNDLSARFRLRLSPTELEVEAEVSDDQLVANLRPDDNRAHWRSDAVEITVDPSGHSQDNSTTFKLGVIVRNTAGHAMAARDADARPGPWNGRLGCTPTASGYRLQVAIPLDQLPSRLQPTFGFNLLLYDIDPGQAPCRLAWSAWETVQGWPELWGRVHLGEK